VEQPVAARWAGHINVRQSVAVIVAGANAAIHAQMDDLVDVPLDIRKLQLKIDSGSILGELLEKSIGGLRRIPTDQRLELNVRRSSRFSRTDSFAADQSGQKPKNKYRARRTTGHTHLRCSSLVYHDGLSLYSTATGSPTIKAAAINDPQ